MRRVIKFFKPFEVLCQFTDPENRRTLKEFIPLKGVYTAGRLDFRSEGLLLLTDDGLLIKQLSDPQFEHPKTYFVQVEGIATEEMIEMLNQRILVPGLQTQTAHASLIDEPDLPARPVPVRNYHPTSWLKIVLCEGKKHQVRRMTAAVGLPTLRLVRYSIGEITLQGLKPGEWKNLDGSELKRLDMRTRT